MIVQPDFLSHWKTRKLCTRMKEKHAPLYVIRLWSLCHTSKRDIIPADCETLAAICEYEGEPEKLMSAMLDCGFLEPEIDGNHIVHGWSEVNQRLIHNWTAGLNGGRPKVTKDKPKENPRVSQTEPIDGLDGLDKIDKRERESGAPSFVSISEIIKAIKSARPEFRNLRDMTLESIINSCPAEMREKTFRDFVENTANMIECPKDPIGLLKGYVRTASSKTKEATGGTSLRFCPVCNIEVRFCKCGKDKLK